MAQPEALALEGPAQRGRGVPGQYVYWIVMAYPTPDEEAKPQARGHRVPG
jgi:hypothetical protein